MAGSGAASPNLTPNRGAVASNARPSAPPPNAPARSADTERARNDANKTRHPGYLTESEYKVSFKDLE
jgi:chitodextrinase